MGTSRKPHRARLRRGDVVRVIAGDDKGETGRILRVIHDSVIPGKRRVVVEGVNLVHRHIRPSQQNPQGGRVRREAPIHISNVMLMDPEQDAPTRVGRQLSEPEKGSLGWERVARKSGAAIGEVVQKKSRKDKKDKKGKE